MKPNKQGKYALKTHKFDSLHLPHPEDLATLLGLPDNIRKMIDSAEFFYQKDLPLKSSTRAKIVKDGFAKPSWGKFITWVSDLPIPLFELFNLSLFRKCSEATRAGSNAGQWFSYLHGFKQSPKRSLYDHEFQALVDFIDARANVDAEVLKNGKKLIKTGKLSIDDAKAQWACQQPIWSDLKEISTTVLTEYDSFVENHATCIKMNQSEQYELSLCILPAVISMKFDFYLAAIANYEIGLMRCAQHNDADPISSTFMCSVIKACAVADKPYYCFTAMIEEFKHMFSKHGIEMGWRELSSYIEINESGTEITKLKDKQYNQLHDWRNNRNLPSDKKFRAFVEAAVKPLNHYGIEHILIYARIARGLDTLVQQLSTQFESEHTLPIIANTLARYPEYLDHYKNKQCDSEKQQH